MLDASKVGIVIQTIREEKGLSQEVVSGLAGIGRIHLSAIERGQRKPTLETFFRLAEALDMPPLRADEAYRRSFVKSVSSCSPLSHTFYFQKTTEPSRTRLFLL